VRYNETMAVTHTVPSTPQTVRSGYLDPAAGPVASVAPGDTVSYPSTWTHWGNEAKFGMSFADREPLRHRYPKGPYSMLGPVVVTGAEPGDVVEVSITRLRTIGWGWNSFPLGVGALPHALFTPDAVLDGTQGRHVGREALRASLAPIWAAEGPATLHLTLTPVVEDDGGEAVVRSVMLIVALTPPITLRTAAAITQTLRRDAGQWKIARRTVSDPAAS
jgi:hypothetical protein